MIQAINHEGLYKWMKELPHNLLTDNEDILSAMKALGYDTDDRKPNYKDLQLLVN